MSDPGAPRKRIDSTTESSDFIAPPPPPQNDFYEPRSGRLSRPSVGVWGPPGTGKTALLCSAFHHIQKMPVSLDNPKGEMNIRWGYEVGIPSEIPGGSVMYSESAKFLEQLVARFADGEMPLATRESGSTQALLEIIYRDNRDKFLFNGRIGRNHILEVIDSPGEHVFQSDYHHEYWQRLRACRGIMFIINGNNQIKDTRTGQIGYQRTFTSTEGGDVVYGYNQLIQSFLNRVCADGHTPFVALCITQMDENTTVRGYTDATDKQNNEGALKQLLDDITDTDMYHQFSNRLGNKFKVFLTSATGWATNDDFEYVSNVQLNPIDGKGKVLRDKKAKPLGVNYALLWLLDNVEKYNLDNDKSRNFMQKHWYKKHRITNEAILRAIYDDLGHLP